MIFKIFIPIMLFVNIYQSDFTSALNVPLLLYTMAAVFIIYLALCFLVPKFVKTRRDASVMVQGIYRSNLVLFGMTIGASIYPDSDIGVIAAISAFVIPEFNILSVILFEAFRGEKADIRHAGQRHRHQPPGHRRGAGHPLFSLSHPPAGTDRGYAGRDGRHGLSPGPDLSGRHAVLSQHARTHKETGCVRHRPSDCRPRDRSAGRYPLGYRDVELVALLAALASPTAVASNPMAQAMGGNGELAGEIVGRHLRLLYHHHLSFVWGLKAAGLVA